MANLRPLSRVTDRRHPSRYAHFGVTVGGTLSTDTTHDDNDAADESKVRSALLGGLTTLVTALAGIGAATGAVSRMFRNHPTVTAIAICLVLTAFLAGLLSQLYRQNWLLAVGAIAVVGGLGSALFAQIYSLATGDRPTVETTIKESPHRIDFNAVVVSGGAKARDQLIVVVDGVPTGQSNSTEVYYAKTGPDTEGKLEQDLHLELLAAKYSRLQVIAYVLPQGTTGPIVDCDGYIVDSQGHRARHRLTNEVSCMNVEIPVSDT